MIKEKHSSVAELSAKGIYVCLISYWRVCFIDRETMVSDLELRGVIQNIRMFTTLMALCHQVFARDALSLVS